MKFYKKYPRAELHQEVERDIVKFKHLEPCHTCKELTEFYQLEINKPFCSQTCIKKYKKEVKNVKF